MIALSLGLVPRLRVRLWLSVSGGVSAFLRERVRERYDTCPNYTYRRLHADLFTTNTYHTYSGHVESSIKLSDCQPLRATPSISTVCSRRDHVVWRAVQSELLSFHHDQSHCFSHLSKRAWRQADISKVGAAEVGQRLVSSRRRSDVQRGSRQYGRVR